ncbi:biopolymer transporter ExbD [Flaviramulus sp. BrNp1-15]|uniref:ExbD/TolR family protein n=1 Tax=Flaviramulus sp. BrNp1-15 TaxID=2916754 RepID=UPI001EE8B1B0|nr:biopolymer transporter ExbD [Flaviramulus sp. BrNp1-15]ULC58156.1 biopolymer transporter ExbD [Flaviramulus sp. BrNp1-15]
MRRSNQLPEVNAGSMADIAFLLLIFFLVTATISSDEGINRMLPKECLTGDCGGIIADKNILEVSINNKDEILIENELATLEEVKNLAKIFIDNNGDGTCNYCNGNKDEISSVNPKKAVISLQNGRHTSYKQFVAVQNELTKAYYELREVYSMNIINKPSDKLSKEELKEVKDAYPFILSEAEIK